MTGRTVGTRKPLVQWYSRGDDGKSYATYDSPYDHHRQATWPFCSCLKRSANTCDEDTGCGCDPSSELISYLMRDKQIADPSSKIVNRRDRPSHRL